jgi:aryl-alcohol dehydrogenase-like predicted oxidoreductase
MPTTFPELFSNFSSSPSTLWQSSKIEVMKQRKIGDRFVGEIGLGCMGMSWAYGSPASASDAYAVLSRALELGANHWDTADLYGSGANEELLRPILAERRPEVFLATKFGNVYDRDLTSHRDQVESNAPWIVDGTPEYIRKCVDRSLQRLGIDQIDLYYQHRVDPLVPIEESVAAMAELVKEGKVLHLGLSEVSAATLRKAAEIHPIAAVQNEFSLWTRDFMSEEVPTTRELGVAFVAYSPLGRGFLTGSIPTVDSLEQSDNRRNMPRFSGDNLESNMEIVAVIKEVAAMRGATPAQIALAWALASSEHIIPIPGTKRVSRLEENCAASDIVLTAEEMSKLNGVQPASGDRYGATAMAYVKA